MDKLSPYNLMEVSGCGLWCCPVTYIACLLSGETDFHNFKEYLTCPDKCDPQCPMDIWSGVYSPDYKPKK